MAREPIFQGGNSAGKQPAEGMPDSDIPFEADDEQFDASLRPITLDAVVGQRKVVERLQIILDATRQRDEPLGHILLDGPPGLGKTTLATVLPKELGVELQITAGP